MNVECGINWEERHIWVTQNKIRYLIPLPIYFSRSSAIAIAAMLLKDAKVYEDTITKRFNKNVG